MSHLPLRAGDARLTISPAGGGPETLSVGDWAILDGYPDGAVPHGHRGHVLAPWPNRLRDGRWSWDGRGLQLPIDDPEHGAAIHGLAAWQHLNLLRQSDFHAVARCWLEPRPGYPFRLQLTVRYVLSARDLVVTVAARNRGISPAPFGAGMHPYFQAGTRVEGTELSLPGRRRLLLDDRGLPTGATEPFDGALGQLGDRVLDDALTDLERDEDGWATTTVRGPAGRLRMSLDRSWPWLMTFTGDTLPGDERRRSVALEPMSCPPDAFNSGTDLVVLAPGAGWQGSWRLSWAPA